MLDPTSPILSEWNTTLASRADAPAILTAGGEVLRTFADIEQEAEEWVEKLGSIPPGTVIALQIGNRAEWPAIILACFRKCHIPLPLGCHIEQHERTMALETCGAGALIEVIGDKLRCATLPRTHVPAWPAPRPDFLKLTSGTTAAPR